MCINTCVYWAARQACPFKRGIFDRFQVYRIKWDKIQTEDAIFRDIQIYIRVDISIVFDSDFIEVDKKIVMKFVKYRCLNP